jgi:hypothetical protein
MTHQHQNSTAGSGSSKAMFQGKNNRKAEIQQQALSNAVTGESVANYQTIFDGFAAMGIDINQVKPRENVFTFNAWKALGRVVKKGQHGVKIVAVIPCTKKDPENGEEVAVKKVKTTTVFHISQTEEIDGAPEDEPQQPEQIATQTVAQEPEQTAAAAIAQEPREMNAYEARQAAKKARFEDRAAQAQADSNAAHSKAHNMASAIPFGQPILVGHHSERRDRNYRSKIHSTFGKAFELQGKAEYYAQKADSVGKGGISSDDPEAVLKLRAELVKCENSQALMKSANKVIRSGKAVEVKTAALVELGFTEALATTLQGKDFAGRVGFANYQLTNNNANIRRIKARIVELEKSSQRADVERTYTGFIYREDVAENRVMFIFEGKPEKAVRELLASNGFRWSPSREGKPWVRQLNNAGLWAGKQVCNALNVAN